MSPRRVFERRRRIRENRQRLGPGVRVGNLGDVAAVADGGVQEFLLVFQRAGRARACWCRRGRRRRRSWRTAVALGGERAPRLASRMAFFKVGRHADGVPACGLLLLGRVPRASRQPLSAVGPAELGARHRRPGTQRALLGCRAAGSARGRAGMEGDDGDCRTPPERGVERRRRTAVVRELAFLRTTATIATVEGSAHRPGRAMRVFMVACRMSVELRCRCRRPTSRMSTAPIPKPSNT